jgi:hypothetical protein
LASYTVGAGGVASVTFAGLPTGGQYAHLELRFIGTRSVSSEGFVIMSFNGDTTNANYPNHDLYGTGSVAGASAAVGSYAGIALQRLGGSDASSTFGAGVVSILDFASVTKNKTVRNLGGIDRNGSGNLVFASGAWLNTSAINSIRLVSNSGNFAEYSQFALYGIRG